MTHLRSTGRTRASRLALGLWLALIAASVILTVAVHATRYLPGDMGLAHELQQPGHLGGLLLPLMVAVSLPGDFPWSELIFIAAVALPLALGRRRPAVFVARTLTGNLLVEVIKTLVARPRPTPDLVQIYHTVNGYSFPSGHVTHYVVFYGAIGYLTWQTRRSLPPGQRIRRAAGASLISLCVILILLIGASRVVLGAHWPTDALGGYLLGGAWLFLLIRLEGSRLLTGRNRRP